MREAVEEAPEQKASSSMCTRHLKTWGYTPCKDALLRKLGLIAVNSLMVVPCPLILNPFSFLNEDLLTPLSGRGMKDGGERGKWGCAGFTLWCPLLVPVV